MLEKLPVPGHPTNLDNSRARAFCACNRYRWGLFGHFFSRLSYLISFSSLEDSCIDSSTVSRGRKTQNNLLLLINVDPRWLSFISQVNSYKRPTANHVTYIHVINFKEASGRFFFHFLEVFEKCIDYIRIFFIHFREI